MLSGEYLAVAAAASAAVASGMEAVDWPRFLPLLELAYNATVNATTGYSPFFVVHGRRCTLPADVLFGDAFKNYKPSEWVAARLKELEVTYDAVCQRLRVHSLHAQLKYDLKREVSTRQPPER